MIVSLLFLAYLSAYVPALNFIGEARAEQTAPLTYLTYEDTDGEADRLKHVAQLQENTTRFLSKYFTRVKPAVIEKVVKQAFKTGEKYDLDPMLILAVIAAESGFNPTATSAVGAQGLMQVHVKVHASRFRSYGGVSAASRVDAGVEVGTQILKEYINRYGSLNKGLKAYVGALNLKSDRGYGAKVLTMRSNLLIAALGEVDSALQFARKGQTNQATLSGSRLMVSYSDATALKHRQVEDDFWLD